MRVLLTFLVVAVVGQLFAVPSFCDVTDTVPQAIHQPAHDCCPDEAAHSASDLSTEHCECVDGVTSMGPRHHFDLSILDPALGVADDLACALASITEAPLRPPTRA